MREEVLTEKEEKEQLRMRIKHLEGIILQQNNMMETCGYYIDQQKVKKTEDDLADEDLLEKVDFMEKQV